MLSSLKFEANKRVWAYTEKLFSQTRRKAIFALKWGENHAFGSLQRERLPRPSFWKNAGSGERKQPRGAHEPTYIGKIYQVEPSAECFIQKFYKTRIYQLLPLIPYCKKSLLTHLSLHILHFYTLYLTRRNYSPYTTVALSAIQAVIS